MAGTPVYVKEPLFDEALHNGSKNVTTAGTPLPLVAISTPCTEVLIQVKRTNTGRIYIGGATVPNDDTGGVMLAPPAAGTTPASISLTAINLNQIYVNSTVNGEGVTFLYW